LQGLRSLGHPGHQSDNVSDRRHHWCAGPYAWWVPAHGSDSYVGGSSAKGPQDHQGFRAWKRGSIMRSGAFEGSGVTYTVMLAPAGRYLASGPSAYLFDEQGQFVDWTADMGDFYTVKNRFDLTSGHVKNIRREKPSRRTE
jgi:hypothetical protein